MAQYCDNFRFYDGDNDSFAFWAGLRGPEGPAGAPGAPGSSVELRGPVATVGDLPESAPADELWMVGAESPYTGYFWNGTSWIDLGYILQGPEGEPGEDGVSPEVTIGTITGGHSVTITDADHPSGQTFNVMDGEDGAPGTPGAAAGFGTPTATVDANVGTPSVTITASGPDTAKVFSFAFTNLKGEPGSGGGGADPYTSPPEDLGASASAGSVDKYSRGDHVHKMPDADDVGAIAKPSSAAAGDYLAFNGSAWIPAAVHGVPAGGAQYSFLMKSAATDYSTTWMAYNHINPKMDGTASPGSGTAPAREDHIHPTDTSRAPADLGISGASAGNLVKIASVSSGAPASFAAAAAGTDYQAPIAAPGILKGNGSGSVSAATAGTDYQTPLTAMVNYQTPVHRATVSLTYNGWSQANSSSPYKQTITISGVTFTANMKMDIQLDADAITFLIGKSVQALYVENTSGTMKAVAVGGNPTGSSSSDNISAQVTYYETV